MATVGKAYGMHFDKVLTEISVRYSQPNLIADRIFPVRQVKKESDVFPIYDLTMFRVVDTARQDGDVAKQTGWGWTLDWYRTEQHSLRDLVTQRQLQNVDDPIDLMVDTTLYLTEQLLLAKEARAAEICTNPANNILTLNLQALNRQWSDYTSSSPKSDITEAANTIFQATGRYPNVIVIPATIARRLLLNEEIKEERKYVNDLTQSGLPRNLWGLEVLEAAALNLPINATDPLGTTPLTPNQGVVMREVWGNNVWIGHVDEPGIRKLTYGICFEARPRNVRQYVDESRDFATWIEVDCIYGLKVISRACGALITNVMAP